MSTHDRSAISSPHATRRCAPAQVSTRLEMPQRVEAQASLFRYASASTLGPQL